MIQALGGPPDLTIETTSSTALIAVTGAGGQGVRGVPALRRRVDGGRGAHGNLLSFAQGGLVISRRALGWRDAVAGDGRIVRLPETLPCLPLDGVLDNIPLPPDWEEKTEWVQARLMYPQHPDARFARFR